MPSQPLRIRDFAEEDFEVLLQIDQICFPADIAFSRGELAFYLNHPKSIARVAEGPGGILGFALARIDKRQIAHMLTLDVLPEARRQKLGMTLMNALHEEIGKKGVSVCILEVAVGNVSAQRLYRKLNYEYLETLNGYYRGREDAYRLIRVAENRLQVES